MNNETGLVPPICPTTPQIPPPQTVTGLLSEDGLPSKFDLPLAGQAPNEAFWKAREELITNFTFSITNVVNDTLLGIDVLNGSDADNNHNYYAAILSNNFFRACELTYPRALLSRSAEYFEGPIKFNFWAIKPQGPKGKIRILYLPHVELTGTIVKNTNIPSLLAYSDQGYLRNNMWEWDLEKQDTFEIEIFGNNPIGKIHNNLNPLTVNDSIFNNLTAADALIGSTFFEEKLNLRNGVPLFSRTYGSLLVQVQNNYIPGSIFASECEIMVFKSMPKANFSLLRGPRTYMYNKVI